MDLLVGIVSIRHAHSLVKDISLQKEFLFHFGPRAAKSRVSDTEGVDEITFWVNLVQKQLQQAIDRERIWSRLTTSESIEVRIYYGPQEASSLNDLFFFIIIYDTSRPN